ncbi:MAG: hypothetical protein WEF50_05765 [Myxococcota bacterium]
MTARALRWLPPALLVTVALHQLLLVYRADLTPWCGGGFGMFSTNDGRFARHLHVYALSPALRVELEIPPELAERARAAAALPEQDRLRALAREFAPYTDSEFEAPESIRLEVYATRWDARTLAPSGVLLRDVEVALAGP